MSKIFLVALFCAYLQQGTCLRCYECTEVTNPNCAKPMKNIATGQCKQPGDVCVIHKTPAIVLSVEEYTANMTMRVIRGCKFKNYCQYVKNFSDECTSCIKDFCNAGHYNAAFLIEVSITAEITGHFIEVEPLTIDFNVCVFNSVYHLPFKIINTSNLPYCVSIKFPSSLKHYLWSDAHQVMIQGGATNTYQLKFIPRSGITRCSKYYDEDTNILEFPVYISISKKHSTIPPRKVVVVAVISEPNGLALSSCDMHTYYNKFCDVDESNECIIDLGQCTTAETVYTTLKLTNNSNVFQIFGFINLPSYLQVMPNFGFGEIMPHETKTLTLSFNPEPKDIPNYNLECEYADTSMSYSIVVETLKNLGGIDEVKFTYAMIANLLERMELALNEKPQRSLMKDVRVLIDLLRNENFFCLSYIDASVEEASDIVVSEILCPSLEIVSGEEEEEEEFVINSNKLSVKATILDPLCYLSYQYVEFPDTPCGSYSVMSIHLRARTYVEDAKCVCYYGKKYGKCKAHLDYKVRFEVVGDCDQISVEPTCGNLKSGQEIRLNLIARPVIPKKEVVKTAMKLKREELLLTTMAQPIPTNKKSQPVTPTQITDKDIVLTRSDLYRTEIELSKCLKPYFLKANFCCTINYMNLQHKLYFKTLCKVTRPSFIHNLKSQHIAFGLVPIGQSKRTVIEIENISEVPIHPVVSLLSPTGFFTVPYLVDLELAPYHVLHLPVTCNPDKPKHVVEYFEVRAGSTIYPLMVSAKGEKPNFTITPDFLVCRLETRIGGSADCALEVNNCSTAPLSIDFVKVCEIEGAIIVIKDPKAKPIKLQKFSDNLNDEELNVISTCKKIIDPSCFRLLGASETGNLQVNPLSKVILKIVFGEPVDPLLKGKKKEKSKGTSPPKPKKYFIVKYNLLVGSKFIKDLIFIGTVV